MVQGAARRDTPHPRSGAASQRRYPMSKVRSGGQGTFHAKMGSLKDRNGMDLTEAEDIKKRWQKYTEELYKKRSSRPG